MSETLKVPKNNRIFVPRDDDGEPDFPGAVVLYSWMSNPPNEEDYHMLIERRLEEVVEDFSFQILKEFVEAYMGVESIFDLNPWIESKEDILVNLWCWGKFCMQMRVDWESPLNQMPTPMPLQEEARIYLEDVDIGSYL